MENRWNEDGLRQLPQADGIRSAVRQVFYPDYKISHGELITLRQVFDASLLKDIPNIPQESCHWPGPDRQLFTSPLSKQASSPHDRYCNDLFQFVD